MLRFVAENGRWLGAGFLLTLASGFGQTWFISLFAGYIKAEHGLTDGGWGSLYTVATLGSAALLFSRGSLADTMRLVRLAPAVAVVFALAAIGIAFAPSLWTVGLAVFLLRFCGQGMFTHMAMTAMGRWFQARRGRAVSIANLGHPTGEAVLPVVAVLAIGAIGWRATWTLAAGALILVVVPLLLFLLSERRTAQGSAVRPEDMPGLRRRHWTRGDAFRHWLFPALLPIMLTPGFIGTVVFFHQVHIAGVKGWSLVDMAPAYTASAGMSVAASLAAGWAADRFGPHRLLPLLLVPTGAAMLILGPADGVSAWYLTLALIGLTQGTAVALWGAFLPAVYGTRNLGAVRSMVTAVMVISTAVGPGVTGLLIDRGIDFPRQALAMAIWCFALSLVGYVVQRRLAREIEGDARVAA